MNSVPWSETIISGLLRHLIRSVSLKATCQPGIGMSEVAAKHCSTTRWRAADVWDQHLAAISQAYDGDIVMIDSSYVHSRRYGAGRVKRFADSCMGLSVAA